MNRLVKRILLAIGILVVAGILFFLGVFLKLRTEIGRMHPVETRKITDRIYSIHDTMVNAYLIRYDEGYIMIDAGNDLNVVQEELKKLNIDESEITAIFLTHSDYDHVASIPLFDNAEIYLNKQELPMINGSQPRLLIQYNKIETDQYNLFVDGQSFKFQDITIRCIHTPGHTPGATCYLVNDQYLFTGDALSLHDGKVDEFIKLATMDLETHRNSIDKIGSIPNIKYIFTAHHGMTDDFDYAFSEWKENEKF